MRILFLYLLALIAALPAQADDLFAEGERANEALPRRDLDN